MKKLTSLGATAFAALLAVLAIVGWAAPAQAYPEFSIDLTVNKTVLFEHQQFTATASSTGVTCAWNLEWNGVVKTGQSSDGDPLLKTYTAPGVSKVTKIPLHGTCTYTAPIATSRNARAAATWTRTIIITVLPRGAAATPPGGSDLPNTGGPDWRVLAGGLVLLLSGAAAVTIARRRAEDAEVEATQA